MKKLIFIIFFLVSCMPSLSVELEEVNAMKEAAYRLGTTTNPETRYSEIEAQKQAN